LLGERSFQLWNNVTRKYIPDDKDNPLIKKLKWFSSKCSIISPDVDVTVKVEKVRKI